MALAIAGVAFLAGLVVSGPSGVSGSGSEGSPSAKTEPTVEFYTCSMHPQIRQPTQTKCPLCGMDLVGVHSGQEHHHGPRELTMSPHAVKLAEIQSVPVEKRFVTAEVRMVGKVEYDESRLSYITAWVPGRLARLFVDYTGVAVQKGDHLVQLYSPELLQAQEELISAVATASDLSKSQSEYLKQRRTTNIVSAREKLRLWGLSEEQIRAIETEGKGSEHITINSPISGVVVHKNAVEGMYVQTGTQVYTIADLSEVWVKLDAYESDLPWLHYGQEVAFSTEAYPGEVFRGQIAFIDPILNPRTRTVKIRVNLPNTEGKLKPDMFVRAVVKSEVAAGGRVMDVGLAGKWISPMHPEIVKDRPGACDICGMDLVSAESLGYVAAENDRAPLVIPASAPLITGRRAVVYVDLGEGRFEGREIRLGARAGDYYLVESGLEQGERVVTKGNFKIDSAIQILAKPSMMNPVEHAAVSEPHGGGISSFDVPSEFKNEMSLLVGAYVGVKDELSHDDLEGAQLKLATLRDGLENLDGDRIDGEAQEAWRTRSSEMMTAIEAMSRAGNLEELRRSFERVSQTLILSVREFGTSGGQPVLLYHCPMAFGGRGGDWLQTKEGTENPYYGSEMFKCGRLKEALVLERDHEGHEHE